MTTVALFRGLNLGHRGSPTRQDLLAAFGGPAFASIFQTNGTVVLDKSVTQVQMGVATNNLRTAGYTHSVVVRSLDEIQRTVDRVVEPLRAENVYRVMVSFFDAPSPPELRLPRRSPDRLVEVRELDAGAAVSYCWKPGSSAGDVTGFVESLVNVPVTTRTLGTLRRLVKSAERASA